jgi:choline transport protein
MGLPINIAALLFCFVVFVFAFFPPMPNPPLELMNWACVVYGGTLTLAFVYYLFVGRHHYVGPVEYVRKGL